MVRDVAIVGAGLTRFGQRSATFRELAQESVKACFDSVPELDRKDVDSVFVGSVQPERSAYQTHVAAMVAEMAGVRPTRVIARNELACGSGQAAVRYAYACIRAGLSDVALVTGIEKMYTKSMGETQASMINVLDREFDGVHGASAPPFFAMCAQRHMKEYGTTREQMALVAVKNHDFASTNPHAQFPKRVTVDKVLNSPMVAPPLTLIDCSGITDGSASIVLAEGETARRLTSDPVYLLGGAQCAIGNNLANLKSLSTWYPLLQTVREAERASGVRVGDMDFMEVHDCFTISEIIIYEDMGLCEKGSGGRFIEEGQSLIGGKMPVNPRGGLLGCGHPLGATGVAQAVEVFQQFRAEVPKERYVGGEYALAHNLSGPANVHSIMVYSRNKKGKGG